VAGQNTHPLSKNLRPARFTRDQLIARAESALENMQEEFSEWIQEEIEELSLASSEWSNSPNDPDRVAELFRRAHDLKGQAPTLGYPIVGRIAASLCELLSISGIDLRELTTLTISHTNAIKAAVRDEVRDDSNNIAAALALELETAVAGIKVPKA
jgi:chemotaxis protein histidine kinase CheA